MINDQKHFRIMKRIKQINNILIKQNLSDKFCCVAPDRRILEEFDNLIAAESWCKETLDFTRKAGIDIDGIITDKVIERMS